MMNALLKRLGRRLAGHTDDSTLARKIEAELFREADAPNANVNVNVVDGVVYLHGDVKQPEQIEQLERDAQRIPEVQEVENFLHLHRTRTDTAPWQQRTTARRSQGPRRPRQATSQPSPRELAWIVASRDRAPGDRSDDPEPHHALTNPAEDPDPTEWPDPYERREDPRDPDDPDQEPFGDEPHPQTGSESTSDPHPSQDPEAEPWEGPKRDKLDQ